MNIVGVGINNSQMKPDKLMKMTNSQAIRHKILDLQIEKVKKRNLLAR
jgi:hypothetical protein